MALVLIRFIFLVSEYIKKIYNIIKLRFFFVIVITIFLLYEFEIKEKNKLYFFLC